MIRRMATDQLIGRLAAAGWDPPLTNHLALTQGSSRRAPCLRVLAWVLDTLLRTSMDSRTGSVRVTTHQLAARAAYSERTVRSCLNLFEELHIIEWHRGDSTIRVLLALEH